MFLLIVKVILVPMVQLLLVVKEIPKVDLVDMRDAGELLKTEIERYGKIL